MSMLAIFIDDDRLPGACSDSPDARFVGGLALSECYSLDNWFEQKLFKELQTIKENADLIYFIHANLRLVPKSLRCFHLGLQVLEHIRFTRSLPDEVRFAPAVLYSFEPSWRLARAAEHPLLLPGAGLAFARLPEHLPSLLDPACWPRWKESAGPLNERKMRDLLAPAEALGGSRLYGHSYRNVAGVGKFCREFAGDVLGDKNGVFARLREEEIRDRRLKRLLAALPELSRGDPPNPADRIAFCTKCKDLRFLAVDDEHARGWSLGLHAGITGTLLTPAEYDSTCLGGMGKTSDGRMHVVARAEDAETLLKETNEYFQRALREWSDAVDKWDQAETRLFSAKDEKERADRCYQDSVRSCGSVLGVARTQMAKAQVELAGSQAALSGLIRESGEKIAEGILYAVPEPGAAATVPESLLQSGPLLGDLRKAIERFNGARVEYERISQQIAEQNAILQDAESSKVSAESDFQAATRALDAAKNNHLQRRNDVKLALPFNVMFLDLRLRPDEDAKLPVADTSGIRILKEHVRKYFPALPVVIMTASEKALSLEQAITAGASGYWIKGVSTGERMRDLVLRAASRARLTPLWTRLQQIRVRRYLNGKMLNVGRTEFQPFRITAKEERQIIDTLLEGCFFRVWEHADSAPGLAADFNRAILNLGIVHEIRYKGVQGLTEADRKNVWTYAKGVEGQDHSLRRLRNDVAHASGSTAASRADALTFLKHTVEQLLGEPE